MTLNELQDEIHVLYENDIDTPASTEDDYILRTRLINLFIKEWKNRARGRWEVLRNVDGTFNEPTLMVNPTDVIQVPDPTYITHSVAARLFQLNRNTTGYTINFQDAEAAMKGMVITNNQAIIDRYNTTSLGDRMLTTGVFGE